MYDFQDWEERNNPPRPRAAHGAATYSGLCRKYGLDAIPPGWDALDVALAAAKHGDALRAVADALIAEQQGKPQPTSAFGAVVETARRAMHEQTGAEQTNE